METLVKTFNIWDNHTSDFVCPGYRWIVHPIDEDHAGIYIIDLPKVIAGLGIKWCGSLEQVHIYQDTSEHQLAVNTSKNGFPILESDKVYDLDKPILYTDDNLVNWSAVKQFDLITKNEIVYEVDKIYRRNHFANYNTIPEGMVVLILTERQRE